MRLIDNWRHGWRMNSVQAAALLAVLSMLQAEVLPHLQAALPVEWWPYISAGFALVIVVVRLRAQPEVHDDAPAKDATP